MRSQNCGNRAASATEGLRQDVDGRDERVEQGLVADVRLAARLDPLDRRVEHREHVVRGELEDDARGVGLLGRQPLELVVVALAVAEGRCEDRGVGGHPDHVHVLDQVGQVPGLQPLAGQVVEPDRHPGVGE